jgi:DNA-binding Xre family transcriptional regulator
MSIRYDGLFRKLEENGITKTSLQRSLKISSTTLAKLSKNEYVSLKVIDDICTALDCQPGDIMEYVPMDSYYSRLISKLRSEKRNKVMDGIYGRLQINSAMASHININFTHIQLKEIYETKMVNTVNNSVSITEIIKIVNYFRCMDYIIEHVREPLNIEFIRIMFRILTNNAYLNRKTLKLEPEFIDTEKKYNFDSYLRNYELVPGKGIDDILFLYSELIKFSPLIKNSYEIFGLLCFKETLRNNIDPFYVNKEIEDNYMSTDLIVNVKKSQTIFKKEVMHEL